MVRLQIWYGAISIYEKVYYIRKKTINDKGFTLVELIVVIVILAVLAAIIVPSLLGFIDRAKASKDIINAKNVLTATQVKMTEAYGKNVDIKEINPSEINNWSGTAFAKDILKVADDEPYMVIVGMGNRDDVEKGILDKKELYTVYFVVYWQKYDSDPLFFDGDEWSLVYPWDGDGSDNNYFDVHGERKHMSFYFIASPNIKTNKWEHLKDKLRATGNDKEYFRKKQSDIA